MRPWNRHRPRTFLRYDLTDANQIEPGDASVADDLLASIGTMPLDASARRAKTAVIKSLRRGPRERALTLERGWLRGLKTTQRRIWDEANAAVGVSHD